jgi:hypothetical protein
MEKKEWIKNQQYLPKNMQDFHDQKDLFKTIFHHWPVDPEKHTSMNGINWVNSMCFTFDFFLRWMALHGYTLQRCRKKFDFHNLEDSVKSLKEAELELLKTVFEKPKAPEDGEEK